MDLRGRPGSSLTMVSSVRVVTTDDPECDQRFKDITYYQYIGLASPSAFEIIADNANFPFVFPDIRPGHLTSIVLAWSYIISCRWVEILLDAGENASFKHEFNAHLSEYNFWNLVINSRWVAQVERDNGLFVAPWMLRAKTCKVKRFETKIVHYHK